MACRRICELPIWGRLTRRRDSRFGSTAYNVIVMSSTLSNPAGSPRTGVRGYDIAGIRAQFPILNSTIHGKPLVYLDNGATTQKPRAVIDAITRYYETENANIHRGVYTLSQVATDLYEEARRKIQRFINAKHSREIIFTHGTTDGINLVASSSLGRFATSARVMKSSFRRWSITPISFRGRSSASRPARSFA